MPIQQEGALETCQRIETELRDLQQRVVVPRAETLTECETQLGMIAASLETLRQSMRESSAASALPQGNPSLRLSIERIQRSAHMLKAQFEHGSNYCMGLLQLRLGTGYSEQGLPVLIPSQTRSCFEG